MNGERAPARGRQFALVALGVWLLEEIVSSSLFVMRRDSAWLQGIPVIPAATFVFFWIVPLVLVCAYERRDARALVLANGLLQDPDPEWQAEVPRYFERTEARLRALAAE
jgi:hypothetical protein